MHVGVLASTEKRDVVDTSCDVSEIMFFNDAAGQKVYQDHPIHMEFVKNCAHLWQKCWFMMPRICKLLFFS